MLLQCVEIIVQLILGIGVICLSWQANKVAKQELLRRKNELKKEDRDTFQQVYSKITQSLGLIIEHGEVSDDALSLIWNARDQSRLYLPKEIEKYAEDLFDLIYRMNIERLQRIQDINQEKREELASNWSKDFQTIMNKKPHEIFSQYLKLNIDPKSD